MNNPFFAFGQPTFDQCSGYNFPELQGSLDAVEMQAEMHKSKHD